MNPLYSRVADRAGHRCEYCHAPEVLFNFPFEVEHITPLSRQGTSSEENLALSCRSCNLHKGTRVSSIDVESETEVDFFHPRRDLWDEHFEADLQTETIRGISLTGRVTVAALEMNSASQIAARQLWIRFGLFP